jgi:hypothetical protein
MNSLELLEKILNDLLKRKEHLESIRLDYAFKDKIGLALSENTVYILNIKKMIKEVSEKNEAVNKNTAIYWNTTDNEIRGY